MGDTTHYVYILRCADGSFYVGLTSNLDSRLEEHRQGLDPSAFTYRRRPLELVWTEAFLDRDEAIAIERQIKGWSRTKRAALIEGGVDFVHLVGRREDRKRNEERGGKN